MAAVMLAIILILPLLVTGLAPVPKREIGLIYNEGSPNAKIKLDFYIDQFCTDSQAAWPLLLKVADHYGPQNLRLRTRVYSASYLRNGYLASKGSYIVDKLANTSMTYSFIGKAFSQLNTMEAEQASLSDNQIMEKLADIAAGMGLQKAEVLALFSDVTLESDARVAWKHAATRKVYEVPTYFLNDVMIDAWQWTEADWQNLLDPMLGIQQKTTLTPTSGGGRGGGRANPFRIMWAWLGVLFLCMHICKP